MSAPGEIRRWRSFALALRAFCVVPFLTGVVDMAGGLWILIQGGLELPSAVAADPTLNSQVRFWGAVWFGWGLLLWWVAGDPRERGQPLRILMATLFLSGLARLPAMFLYGMPASPLIAATTIELVAPMAFMAWHRALGARG